MTPEEYANKRADEMLFPKRLQEANEMAMKRGKNFGYQVRPKLFPGEIEYFKKNPNTPGYADFESDSIVLNPFSTLPAEELTFLVDNESIRLKMNKDKFVPPDFKITPEQKKFFEETPKLSYTIKYKNSLDNKREIHLNSLNDFFTLR